MVIGDNEAACEHFAGLLTAAHPMGYQQVMVKPAKRGVNGNGNHAEGGYEFAGSLAEFDDVYLIGVNDGVDSPAGAEGVLALLLKQGKSVHIIPSLLDTRAVSPVAGRRCRRFRCCR